MKILKRLGFYVVIILCLTNTQCDDDNSLSSEMVCDFEVVIDENEYNNAVSAEFTFSTIIVEDHCLYVEITASGCDGTSWTFNLIDSGAVAESSPEQRFLKLQLINEEACLAVFTRSVTFDISSLQIENSNEIALNIEGYDGPVIYSY